MDIIKLLQGQTTAFVWAGWTFKLNFWVLCAFTPYSGFLILLLITGAFEFLWADKACPSSSGASYTFKWWWSAHRCLLGTILSFRWYQWQNPSCYWGRCLPPPNWTFTVSIACSFWCNWYFMFFSVQVLHFPWVLMRYHLWNLNPINLSSYWQSSISISAHPGSSHSWKYCHWWWYADSGIFRL